MKKYILLILVMMGTCSLWAQSPPQIKPLTIGDTVPDITFNHILNDKDTTAKLSDFRGKLVILDFWATYCSGCVGYLPHLDSLQQKFKAKLRIIPVTRENKERVASFIKRNKLASKARLSFITNDTILSSYFPHLVLPHEVWISPEGIVTAITFPQYINTRNIETVLNSQRVGWPVKKDIIDFDPSKPLYQSPNNVFNPIFYTTLTSYIDGIPYINSRYHIDKAENKVRFLAVNNSILELYGMTLPASDLMAGVPLMKRLVLDIKDSSRFIYNRGLMYKDAWNRVNEFCYEAIFSSEISKETFKKKMIEDLNLFFDLDGQWQYRPVSCMVLRGSTQSFNLLRIQDILRSDVSLDDTSRIKFIHNSKLSNLIFALNSLPDMPIVIDETDLSDHNVNIDLGSISMHNIQSLNSSLKRYGLSLVRQTRKIRVLVLRRGHSASYN